MTSPLHCAAGKADPVGPGLNLNFDADDDFLGDGAKASNLPDFSDLDKQLQQEDCNAAVNQVRYPSAIDEHLWLSMNCSNCCVHTVTYCCYWISQDGYPAAATAPSVIVAEAPDANILKTRTYVSHSTLFNCWVWWDVHGVHRETKSESWVRTVLFFGFDHTSTTQKKTSKSFSLYKRSIDLLWGKGMLRKSSCNIQVISSLVPYCAVKILPYSLTERTISFESCSLFALEIWFIHDVSGQGTATSRILWMSA